uniref:Uncharacterized protein n=1 Tax=Rhizophora mucronata TaxID=61149 RepID=A0A2P2PDT3_RHIMU
MEGERETNCNKSRAPNNKQSLGFIFTGNTKSNHRM